jgi:hypothetical protein
MEVTFDLISDLNIIHSLDWEGQPESLMCIVAGNISEDRVVLTQTLEHLAGQYKHVFFVDGPKDHKWEMDNLPWSFIDIVNTTEPMKNVTYLHNQVCILDGKAIVPVNGWYSLDFNPEFEIEQQFQWMKENGYVNTIDDVMRLMSYGASDVRYLYKTIQKMQEMDSVKEIIIVSSVVPDVGFVEHDTALKDTPMINLMGNSQLINCLEADVEKKVSTWMFGTYQNPTDQIKNNIRFVSNPKGLPSEYDVSHTYHPKRIQVQL